MLRQIKKVWKKYGKAYGVINGMILLISVATLPGTCDWIVYQPDIPQGLMEFKE